jgi:hypothetical protein
LGILDGGKFEEAGVVVVVVVGDNVDRGLGVGGLDGIEGCLEWDEAVWERLGRREGRSREMEGEGGKGRGGEGRGGREVSYTKLGSGSESWYLILVCRSYRARM